MRRLAGVVILVVGIVLVVWDANASQSASSEISMFFTGAATKTANSLIVGGAIAILAGVSMAWSSRGKRG